MAAADYNYIETGPFGYFPTDTVKPRDETSKRGLTVIADTQFGILHKPREWANAEFEMRRNATVLEEIGAKFLVYLPPTFRSDMTWTFHRREGTFRRAVETVHQQRQPAGQAPQGTNTITMVVHPHGDSHIESRADIDRFFADTDPAYVSFCLDRGHIVYGGEGPINVVRDYPERIGFVHIKTMDPELVRAAHEKDWPFGEAIARGASVTPPAAEPEMKTLVKALAGLDRETIIVVEQDLYPVNFDFPLPNAIATRKYLAECNLGARADATAEAKTTATQTAKLTCRSGLGSSVGRDGSGAHREDHQRAVRQEGGRGLRPRRRARQGLARPLGANVYADGGALIRDEDLDAIMVTSFGPAHKESLIEACEPVFCEKPLAPTAAACRRIMAAEQTPGRRLVQVGRAEAGQMLDVGFTRVPAGDPNKVTTGYGFSRNAWPAGTAWRFVAVGRAMTWSAGPSSDAPSVRLTADGCEHRASGGIPDPARGSRSCFRTLNARSRSSLTSSRVGWPRRQLADTLGRL